MRKTKSSWDTERMHGESYFVIAVEENEWVTAEVIPSILLSFLPFSTFICVIISLRNQGTSEELHHSRKWMLFVTSTTGLCCFIFWSGLYCIPVAQFLIMALCAVHSDQLKNVISYT